ncbi:MAG: DUF6252 family protein [Bacteroidota bacterium]
MSRLLLLVLVAAAGALLHPTRDRDCEARAQVRGTLSATIDGDSAEATCLQGDVESGTLTLKGTVALEPGDRDVRLRVPGAQAGQTYTLSPDAAAAVATIEAPGEAPASGAGQVSLQTVTASGASGTFAFTARDESGAVVEVTGGQFDLTF